MDVHGQTASLIARGHHHRLQVETAVTTTNFAMWITLGTGKHSLEMASSGESSLATTTASIAKSRNGSGGWM